LVPVGHGALERRRIGRRAVLLLQPKMKAIRSPLLERLGPNGTCERIGGPTATLPENCSGAAESRRPRTVIVLERAIAGRRRDVEAEETSRRNLEVGRVELEVRRTLVPRDVNVAVALIHERFTRAVFDRGAGRVVG
jgi:hypothetical protein